MELEYKEHPLLDAPSDEDQLWMLENDPEAYLQSIQMHNDRIEASIVDPVYHSFVLPQQFKVRELLWKDVIDEVWVLGGVRSGKSRSAAWMVMQALMENPNTQIICWAQNEKASQERQQPYLWEMMPAEYKKKMVGEIVKISYKKSTGFAGDHFILPNGSVCLFKYYTQFQQDDSTIEGATLGAPVKDCKFINIGTWCDEYLGDETLLIRLRSRCADFDAKILVTFTPQRGYTPTVGSMLDGAKIIESRPASMLDGEQMPYIMEPADRENMAVVFYHSQMNPFNNWKRLKRNHAKASVEEIKKNLYGYPTKSMTAMFGTFDQVAHIYDPAEEHIDFANGEWTNYQVIDPAGAKSWACAWYGVNSKGDIRQWGEWPDLATFGEWAKEGKSSTSSGDAVTWKKGPAAEDCGGLSFRSLQMEWEKAENGIPIYERIIDIRFAHGPHQTAMDGKRTLQDDLTEFGIHTVGSCGFTEEVGLPKIQEWLSFDSKQPFCPHTNSPTLRISKDCGNSIFSFMNYCQNGKKDEPLKDFIDLPRYAATHDDGAGIAFYGKGALSQKTQGGSY